MGKGCAGIGKVWMVIYRVHFLVQQIYRYAAQDNHRTIVLFLSRVGGNFIKKLIVSLVLGESPQSRSKMKQ
jgi:hypothetical protein